MLSPALVGPALVILCVAVYLPGLFVMPVVDRDEARFIQASRQMLESQSVEGWVIPRVQDDPRLNKPPAIYWAQAASAAIFTGANTDRDAAWMYRLPSALFATLSVLMVWRIGVLLFPGRHANGIGALAATMLAIAPVIAWEARQGRSDQLLLTCTLGAMWALAATWMRVSSGRKVPLHLSIALWLAIGAGVLAKGPITPMLVVLCALMLCIVRGRWRWIGATRPLIGVAIVALMVLPWVLLVMREVGASNYAAIVYDEVLGRSGAPKEGHWGPPGYHLILMPVLFWPGSMLTGIAFVRAWRRAFIDRRPELDPDLSTPGRLRRFFRHIIGPWSGREAELFLIAWTLPAWIVFELVATKLPHYTMPLYPALALISSRAVFAAASGAMGDLRKGAVRFGLNAWLVIGAVIGVFAPLILLIIAGGIADLQTAIAGIALVALCAAALVLTAKALANDRFMLAQRRSIAAGALAMIALAGVVIPGSSLVWISDRAASAMLKIDAGQNRPLAAAGFREDSLVFNTQGRLERLSEEDLPAWLDTNPDGLVLLTEQLFKEHEPRLAELDRLRGFNYSNGKSVKLIIAQPR